MLWKILEGVAVVGVTGSENITVKGLKFDSRQVEPGDLFFAVLGTDADGHNFIETAIEKGAVAIVCQSLPDAITEEVTYIQVEDSSATMGCMAANFYDNPSRKLKLVGVTGTNGKTTTATLLYDLMESLGYKAGLISTVIYRIGEREIASTHTTPDAITLNAMLAQMVGEGCQYCFMEVSSHSIVQHRISGLEFAGGIFTNLTHDHLDYHGSFAEYLKAKKMFFDQLPAMAFALINVDDRNGSVMVQNTKAKVKTFSLRSFADYKCRIVETHLDGMLLNIDSREVWVNFLGRFNAYNLLGVYGTALLLGEDRDQVLTAMSRLHSVSGRFEYLRSAGGITAIVDYAHTPDALQNVIDTINETRIAGQKLYVVVGCGGNRDTTKRPVMARIAASLSDLAILTSDNPRFEDPDDIIAQMREGVELTDRFLAITDRREAIKSAVMLAAKDDIILVAGKGHEDYQEVRGEKHHFDDKEELAVAFTAYKK